MHWDLEIGIPQIYRGHEVPFLNRQKDGGRSFHPELGLEQKLVQRGQIYHWSPTPRSFLYEEQSGIKAWRGGVHYLYGTFHQHTLDLLLQNLASLRFWSVCLHGNGVDRQGGEDVPPPLVGLKRKAVTMLYYSHHPILCFRLLPRRPSG